MSLTFSVDDKNDLYIGRDGNISLSGGLASVLQACAHAVKAQLGEMVLATNQGVPNFQTIWNGVPNIAQFEAALRQTILGVADVSSVASLTTVISNKELRYRASIVTTFGEGVIEGVVNG